MKKHLAGIAICAALSPTALADTVLGIYAGAATWQSSLSGDFNSEDQSDIDTEDQLGLDDEDANTFYVALEHPIPLVPNVKLRRTELDYSERTALVAPVTFEGQTFSGTTESTIDLSHTDGTLYYELLDNVVSLDVGLTARVFDGKVELADADSKESIDLDATLPMLYGAVLAKLPLTGLYAGVEANYISVGEGSLYDATAKIGYESSIGLGVEGGYRVINLSLEDVDDLESDLTSDGAYAAVTYHF